MTNTRVCHSSDFPSAGRLSVGRGLDPLAARFEIYGQKRTEVVEDRRHDGRDDNIPILEPDLPGDEKRHDPHYRGHDLSAGRRGSLDRSRQMPA